MKTQTPLRERVLRTLFIVISLLFASSCGDSEKDDPEPDVKLSATAQAFITRRQMIILPSAMLASNNELAKNTVSYVSAFNSIAETIFTFDDLPENEAVYSNTPIGTTSGSVDVYTWTDNASNESLAYQISSQSDLYTFEIFFKNAANPNWFRYVYSEESKDGSSNFIYFYDQEKQSMEPYASYTWTSNILNAFFKADDASNPDQQYRTDVKYNSTDKSGTVEVHDLTSGTIPVKAEWDSAGNGIFKVRLENGDYAESAWTI